MCILDKNCVFDEYNHCKTILVLTFQQHWCKLPEVDDYSKTCRSILTLNTQYKK